MDECKAERESSTNPGSGKGCIPYPIKGDGRAVFSHAGPGLIDRDRRRNENDNHGRLKVGLGAWLFAVIVVRGILDGAVSKNIQHAGGRSSGHVENIHTPLGCKVESVSKSSTGHGSAQTLQKVKLLFGIIAGGICETGKVFLHPLPGLLFLFLDEVLVLFFLHSWQEDKTTLVCSLLVERDETVVLHQWFTAGSLLLSRALVCAMLAFGGHAEAGMNGRDFRE
jgi:hypothetical protein